MTLYTGGPTWFIAVAIGVLAAVTIYEIGKRMAERRRKERGGE